MQIKNRFTSEVIFENDSTTMRDTVLAAYAAKKNLRSADLSSADLSYAVLRSADLSSADLRYAVLSSADLSSADLSSADLSSADLRYAVLRSAVLSSADLRSADLRSAVLRSADLRSADLNSAVLSSAVLSSAVLDETTKMPYAPKIPDLDKKILAAIEAGGTLEMDAWHECETTHCRGGWAVHLAGEAGKVLEQWTGSAETAAMLIYHASTGRVPDFFASNEDALADIKKAAGIGTQPGQPEGTVVEVRS